MTYATISIRKIANGFLVNIEAPEQGLRISPEITHFATEEDIASAAPKLIRQALEEAEQAREWAESQKFAQQQAASAGLGLGEYACP